MINLLPLLEKKEIEQEKNWKIMTILGILFLVFLAFLSLVLFLTKTYLSQKAMAQKILVERKEEKLNMLALQQFEEKIKQGNLILAELKAFYQQQPYFIETIKEISQTLPQGVYLTSLSLKSQLPKEQKIECRLLGFSPIRESLKKFKGNLEKANFKNVFFPPITWVKPTDINFSATFQIEL